MRGKYYEFKWGDKAVVTTSDDIVFSMTVRNTQHLAEGAWLGAYSGINSKGVLVSADEEEMSLISRKQARRT